MIGVSATGCAQDIGVLRLCPLPLRVYGIFRVEFESKYPF